MLDERVAECQPIDLAVIAESEDAVGTDLFVASSLGHDMNIRRPRSNFNRVFFIFLFTFFPSLKMVGLRDSNSIRFGPI